MIEEAEELERRRQEAIQRHREEEARVKQAAVLAKQAANRAAVEAQEEELRQRQEDLIHQEEVRQVCFITIGWNVQTFRPPILAVWTNNTVEVYVCLFLKSAKILMLYGPLSDTK